MDCAVNSELNKVFNTVGGSVHVGGLGIEHRVDKNNINVGSLIFTKADGVKDNLIKKFTTTLNGISFNTFGEDERNSRREFSVRLDIELNMHGDENIIVVRATVYSDGRLLSCVCELNMLNKSVITLTGTIHINDGDIECIEANKIIICVRGKVVNVVNIAVNKLTSIGRGNSLKRQGVTISTLTRFSMSIDSNLFTSFKDFNFCNKIVDADVDTRHSVDGETTDNFLKKRRYMDVGTDVDNLSLDDIRVTKLTTT